MFASSLRAIAGAALACTVLAHTTEARTVPRLPIVALQSEHQQFGGSSRRRVHSDAHAVWPEVRTLDHMMQMVIATHQHTCVVGGPAERSRSERATFLSAAAAHNAAGVSMQPVPCCGMLLVPYDPDTETTTDACIRGSPCPDTLHVLHDAPTQRDIDRANTCLWATVPPAGLHSVLALRAEQSAARLYQRKGATRGVATRHTHSMRGSSDDSGDDDSGDDDSGDDDSGYDDNDDDDNDDNNDDVYLPTYFGTESLGIHPRLHSYAMCIPSPASAFTVMDFACIGSLHEGECENPNIRYPFIFSARVEETDAVTEVFLDTLTRYSPRGPFSAILSSLQQGCYLDLLRLPNPDVPVRCYTAFLVFDYLNFAVTCHYIDIALVNLSPGDTLYIFADEGFGLKLGITVPITSDMGHLPSQPAKIYRYRPECPIPRVAAFFFRIEKPYGEHFPSEGKFGLAIPEMGVHVKPLEQDIDFVDADGGQQSGAE